MKGPTFFQEEGTKLQSDAEPVGSVTRLNPKQREPPLLFWSPLGQVSESIYSLSVLDYATILDEMGLPQERKKIREHLYAMFFSFFQICLLLEAGFGPVVVEGELDSIAQQGVPGGRANFQISTIFPTFQENKTPHGWDQSSSSPRISVALSIKNKAGFVDGTIPEHRADEAGYTVFYIPTAKGIWDTISNRFSLPDDNRVCQIYADICALSQGGK
ncbi:hypothetical protein M569_00067 [Genlisea aurea]|uniref:Uncharacterized protein n=1 Tax=Genlisea aurea TaxID=192259 RepID=S8EP65_9LAMI|nr:hypothetical protein M569_00067 [Genlisea aurea]